MSQNRLGVRPHLHISMIINACCAIIYMTLSCPQTHCCVARTLSCPQTHCCVARWLILDVIYRMLVCQLVLPACHIPVVVVIEVECLGGPSMRQSHYVAQNWGWIWKTQEWSSCRYNEEDYITMLFAICWSFVT